MQEQLFRPADKLSVWLEHNSDWIRLRYEIDQEFSGSLEFRASFETSGVENHLFDFLGTCGAIFLAQLCLASRVDLNFSSNASLFSGLEPTIRTLYAVRAFRDGIEPTPRPHFNMLLPRSAWQQEHLAPNQRAILLWSGGLDSTLSLLLLKGNGYDVIPLHVSYASADAGNSELEAVQRLSLQLGMVFETVDIHFSQFLTIATRYSVNARDFPGINSVPHGRELIILPIALIFALKVGASNICFGFENSAWTEQFEHEGKRYSRYDTQSEFCNINLQDVVHNFVSPSVSLFSPVAPITEYRKFRTIVTQFPDLVRDASFCYWGETCGLCSKCAMYYLFQRSLGLDVIRFKHDPIREETAFIRKAMLNWSSPNSRDSNFALAKIVANGDVRPGEELLIEYRDKIYPNIQHSLEDWENELMRTRSVALLPANFNMEL